MSTRRSLLVDWEFLMDKETNCLTSWEGGCLSQGRRLVLLGSCEYISPCLSACKQPSWPNNIHSYLATKEFLRLLRNSLISGILLWQGNYGYCLVSWVVCKLKGKGIRGIGSLRWTHESVHAVQKGEWNRPMATNSRSRLYQIKIDFIWRTVVHGPSLFPISSGLLI